MLNKIKTLYNSATNREAISQLDQEAPELG